MANCGGTKMNIELEHIEACFMCGVEAEIHTCDCVLSGRRYPIRRPEDRGAYTSVPTEFFCHACLNPDEFYDNLFHARAYKFLCKECYELELELLRCNKKATAIEETLK